MMLAMSSVTSEPRMMIRSRSSRLKISDVGFRVERSAAVMGGVEGLWVTGSEASGTAGRPGAA
jgi:hypothetical protein